MIHALVVAAGQARRFGGDTPKQYLSLTTKSTQTLLQYSVAALAQHKAIGQCTIVVAKDDGFADTLVFALPVRLVIGGMERWQSVLNGVQQIAKTAHKDDLVLIHDAARPCLSLADLSAVIDVAKKERYGAILATPVVDTLKKGGGQSANKQSISDQSISDQSISSKSISGQSTNEKSISGADGRQATQDLTPSNHPNHSDGDSPYIAHTVPRQDLWQAQTPQIYRLGALLTVLEWIRKQHRTKRHKSWQLLNPKAKNVCGDVCQHFLSQNASVNDGLAKGHLITDEAMGFEALGLPIRLVAGSASNIKVTYPADMALAQAILVSQGR